MIKKIIVFVIIALSICSRTIAQTCTTLGQNPSTAFPVCGTSTFSQKTVPYCGGRFLPGACSSDGVADYNPFWYKFTCFSAGTLGFRITPNDQSDDYDWELFDITNRSPDDIYTDPSLIIACNWSGIPGNTGASSAGMALENCAGYAYPPFSSMPYLKLNHNYLLLLSHFTLYTPSQNGYSLSFAGGTASITDPLVPDLLHATATCNAMNVIVAINKPIKCSSIATDGSDFTISYAAAKVIAASGISCSSSFDVDSIMLTLNNPLPPGTYTVTIKNGSDANTLLDNCDRNIDEGRNVSLKVIPLLPTPLDSLTAVRCAPKTLQLIFEKNILCNSIAEDGSDFIITGPTPVTITSASGNCMNGESNSITIKLSAPIFTKGDYKLRLVKGNDGNTLIDECGQQTPAGSFINFTTADTVSAGFTYNIFKGCNIDTIAFFHNGNNEINQWYWTLADAGTSTLQNPEAYYTAFGNKQISLAVSNGVCNDRVTETINLDNTLKASFETNNLLCPEDTATFINKSIGDIIRYNWNFGNGVTSSAKTPAPLHYPILSLEKIYPVQLVVENTAGCFDTATNNIKVLKSCYIAVPSAFTPNGDGLNDYLYPLNAYKADDLEFDVYNRVGQRVFHTTDWTVKWDGTINGNPQDAGIFVWTLRYTNHDTGKKVFQKGSTMLIR